MSVFPILMAVTGLALASQAAFCDPKIIQKHVAVIFDGGRSGVRSRTLFFQPHEVIVQLSRKGPVHWAGTTFNGDWINKGQSAVPFTLRSITTWIVTKDGVEIPFKIRALDYPITVPSKSRIPQAYAGKAMVGAGYNQKFIKATVEALLWFSKGGRIKLARVLIPAILRR